MLMTVFAASLESIYLLLHLQKCGSSQCQRLGELKDNVQHAQTAAEFEAVLYNLQILIRGCDPIKRVQADYMSDLLGIDLSPPFVHGLTAVLQNCCSFWSLIDHDPCRFST